MECYFSAHIHYKLFVFAINFTYHVLIIPWNDNTNVRTVHPGAARSKVIGSKVPFVWWPTAMCLSFSLVVFYLLSLWWNLVSRGFIEGAKSWILARAIYICFWYASSETYERFLNSSFAKFLLKHLCIVV